MNSCERVTAMMGEVIDANVPFKVRMGVGAHVIMCRNCRLYFKQMKAVVHLTKLAEPKDTTGPSAELEAMLCQAFSEKYGRG